MPAPSSRLPGQLRFLAAAYWVFAASAVLAWHLLLEVAASQPLGVHLALVGMGVAAAAWGHTVLFPRRLADAPVPAAPEARLAPESLVLHARRGAAPAPRAPGADPVLRDIARAALAEPRVVAGDAALARELEVRREFDPHFAAAVTDLGEVEARALLVCARHPEARGRLAACAELLRVLHRFGAELPADAALLRRRDALAELSEPLAQEFMRVMGAAPDLDPAEVARRLLERHAAGQGEASLFDERRLAEAVEAATGVKVLARVAGEGAGRSASLVALPRHAEPGLPLALLLQACGMAARDDRAEVRLALAEVVRSGEGLRAGFEAYVAGAALPGTELAVRIRARQGDAAGSPAPAATLQPAAPSSAASRPSPAITAGAPPPAASRTAPPQLVATDAPFEPPAALTRWRLIDSALEARQRAA